MYRFANSIFYLPLQRLLYAYKCVRATLGYWSVKQFNRVNTFPITVLAAKPKAKQMARNGGHGHFCILVVEDVMLEFVQFVEL